LRRIEIKCGSTKIPYFWRSGSAVAKWTAAERRQMTTGSYEREDDRDDGGQQADERS